MSATFEKSEGTLCAGCRCKRAGARVCMRDENLSENHGDRNHGPLVRERPRPGEGRAGAPATAPPAAPP